LNRIVCHIMAQFIHLSDERLIRRIAKSGIKPSELWDTGKRYVYATPVLKDFMISHQWLRELKGRGVRTIAAIQFRIPDGEPVMVGPFGAEPLESTAAGATRVFMEHKSGLGLQVMIPRKILAKEITRTYLPPQLIGWRYYPEAHGKPPFCGCEYCQRGVIKSRKIRAKYKKENGTD
jgi:hypothetical protein